MQLKELYRRIIRLHRHLPIELRIIGDRYAQAEFKAFVRTNSTTHWPAFQAEWSRYLEILSNQLPDERKAVKPETIVLGKPLDPNYVLNEEQRENLEKLRREASAHENKI